MGEDQKMVETDALMSISGVVIFPSSEQFLGFHLLLFVLHTLLLNAVPGVISSSLRESVTPGLTRPNSNNYRGIKMQWLMNPESARLQFFHNSSTHLPQSSVNLEGVRSSD